MVIAFDGVAFENTYQLGIQRYFYELISRLPKSIKPVIYFAEEPRSELVPINVDRVMRPEFRRLTKRKPVQYIASTLKKNFFSTRVPPSAIFHSTYFTQAPDNQRESVLTVHDMIAECLPYHFIGDASYEMKKKAECILSASHIIAISDATADAIVKVYPETKGKITTIHHGADHLPGFDRQLKSSCQHKNSEQAILYVGDRGGYKNFATLLNSLQCPAWPKKLKLRVVGKPFSEVEKVLISYLNLNDIIVELGRITDDELAIEYRSATAFIFPSLQEGFGFPLVEAQINGTPVLCSDIPVFHEISGGHAIFFNPTDPFTIAEACLQILDPLIQKNLSQGGLENVRRFTWQRCMEKTTTVWKNVAAD